MSPDYSQLSDAELTEKVANHVMGWEIRKYSSGAVAYIVDGNIRVDFEPTKNWNDTSKVQKRMNSLGYGFMVLPVGKACSVTFFSWDTNRRGQAECDGIKSFPRAICEAALSAVSSRP